MSILNDINTGRDQYRKRNSMRTRSQFQRRGQNKYLVEFGKFMEFVVSKLWRTDSHNTATAVQERRASPYMTVLRRDIKGFLDWVCDKFPQKQKEYDPLYAAWERGRRGGN